MVMEIPKLRADHRAKLVEEMRSALKEKRPAQIDPSHLEILIEQLVALEVVVDPACEIERDVVRCELEIRKMSERLDGFGASQSTKTRELIGLYSRLDDAVTKLIAERERAASERGVLVPTRSLSTSAQAQGVTKS